MQTIDWKRLEGKFWKPENETQYLVEFSNPRIEERTYGETTAPKTVIVMDVLSVQRDDPDGKDITRYMPPKEFSTRNSSFISAIRPIIDDAIRSQRDSIIVLLRRTGVGKEVLYSVNNADFIQKYRRMNG